MSTKPLHGGARPGAGRKSGSGAFGEATVVRRIPQSAVPLLENWLAALKQGEASPGIADSGIPLFVEGVRAGFPSPAQGDEMMRIDLNQHLIANPTATILLRAQGDSMMDAGIGDGDLLVVDRSAEAYDGAIVIASLDNAFTVKTLRRPQGRIELHPANAQAGYPVIRPAPDEELRLIGVVRWIIKKV